MNLIEQVDSKRKEIKTDGYPMSIGEWINLYESGELDIHPDFQRFFRWSEVQKTGLIESILLGIPLPSIFVSQRSDGVWDVVDGLQRLSTIFQFIGILKSSDGTLIEPLILQPTKYLPKLGNVGWTTSSKKITALPKELQLVVKRSKIPVSIVLKESDANAKYDLFQRLNTGGSELSQQEVRNCLLLMINKPMFEWLKKLSKYENFIESTALSDNSLIESYDVELALRFIIFYDIEETKLKALGDVGEFLTEQMTQLANTKINKKFIKDIFNKTFDILNEVMGDSAFKRFSNKKSRNEGGFLLSLFEVTAFGVAFNIKNNSLCEQSEITNRAKLLWANDVFKSSSSSGVRASSRLPNLIPLGRETFKKQP